ncbi:hypothetical protein [Acidipropionibacterium acidipropionici]|uniref:hypothetical protein n=1 Tax=Acidipropionibacterium acidipropionici TaxID=1748 RepID=UPI00110BE42E|nr:hypothetical protein [Acidipropionibacterium acidipropionici]QCV95646.1 hypothetical protein FEZ30_10625 [Acidipropionibacterium acidipropionici]
MTPHETGWTVRHRHGHPDTWHPGCTCGWEGQACGSEAEAEAQLDRHLHAGRDEQLRDEVISAAHLVALDITEMGVLPDPTRDRLIRADLALHTCQEGKS